MHHVTSRLQKVNELGNKITFGLKYTHQGVIFEYVQMSHIKN